MYIYIYINKILQYIIYIFVDLEKAFDRVPREVLWWALRRLGVEGGMIRLIKAMYAGSTTAVKVQGEGTESFEVRVGVHQGSVLSPLLFVMVWRRCQGTVER